MNGKNDKLAKYGPEHAAAGAIEFVDTGDRLGPCPSCKGEIAIGTAPDPANGGKSARVLLHAMPFCAYFGDTKPQKIVADIERAARAHARRTVETGVGHRSEHRHRSGAIDGTLPDDRASSVWQDEDPKMKPGDIKTILVGKHQIRITATDKTGFTSGRRLYRVECVTCNILVHPGSTSAKHQIDAHLEHPTQRWPGT